MDDDELDRTLAELVEERRRRAFNSAQTASNHVGSDVSRGLRVAAENLLDKAVRQLAAGDRDGARRFAAKALALPFDEHEEEWPGRSAAHMRLFTALADGLDEDDPDWLDAVEALARISPPQTRDELGAALAALLVDYRFAAAELRRLRPLAGSDMDAPPLAGVPDGAAPDAVLDLLDAVRQFEDRDLPL